VSEVVLEYLGTGWVMGVPARDLTERDLDEVREREGITRDEIEGSGLYRVVGESSDEEVGDG